MKENISKKVKEGWSGPGRRDGVITPLTPQDDALHIDVNKKKMYEWWYFDAHLDSGHTIVAFFYASNANPGPTSGKTGVELVLLRPDGRKTQKFIEYPKSDFNASSEKADVRIGDNYLTVDYPKGNLPVYRIHLDEKELGFDLTYAAEVKGWKPGTGFSHFGEMGYFAWVVPFAKASVKGTIRDGSHKFSVSGVGYHDHNWLNFAFQSIIEYWMWGRIYSKNFTVCYAFIQCNEKVDRHAVKVLMLAHGRNPILSTGNFEFTKQNFEYSPQAKHSFPRSLTIRAPGEMEVRLNVEKVLEAEDMLDRFGSMLRFLAKHVLRIKPGYFRLQSAFELEVQQNGKKLRESGSTLHEVVLFKSAE
jgi:predicted secreted hydrolase